MKHTAKNILVGTIGAAGLFLASTATANADTTHTVAKNDTVWDLAQKYGVSIQSIEKLNNIDNNTHLIVTGQTLKVPASSNTTSTENTSSEENTSADTENTTDVTVQSGDTLWDLAQKYGTTVAKLRELNGLSADTTLIHPGKVLKVNGTAQATQTTADTTATTDTTTQAADTTQTEDTTTQTSEDTTAQTQETQTPQVTVSANHTTYTVQAGDSLYSIAQAYGVTVDSLRAANTLGATLAVGQTLTINDPTKDPSATQQAAQDTTAQTQTTTQAAQDTTAQDTTAQTQTTTQAAQDTTTQTTTQATQDTTAQTQNTQQQTTQDTTAQQSTQQQTTQSASAATATTTTTTTTSSVSGSAIAAYAQTFIGVPYVWGGSTPSGFDCSGLTQYVYAHFGKQIGRNTVAQESAGTRIPVSQAQVGDLLFWGSAGSTYHVAIYLGGNSYIAAPEPGQSVKIGNMAYFMPSFAVHVN